MRLTLASVDTVTGVCTTVVIPRTFPSLVTFLITVSLTCFLICNANAVSCHTIMYDEEQVAL